MKLNFFALLTISFCTIVFSSYAKGIKTKTHYRAYDALAAPAQPQVEFIQYYDANEKLVREESYGSAYIEKDSGNKATLKQDYTQIATRVQYTYNDAGQLVFKKYEFKTCNSTGFHTIDDYYSYLGKNKVVIIQVDRDRNDTTTNTYLRYKNDELLSERYTYTFDKNGNLTKRTTIPRPNIAGSNIKYTYNKQGLLATTLEKGPRSYSAKTLYGYSPTGKLLRENTSMLDGKVKSNASVQYLYNDKGLCVQETTCLSNEGCTIKTYSYEMQE